MSTIRDIARKAGVSVSTASLALNGDARVRPVTRDRVLAVAEELEYHPNRAARSLSSGRTYGMQIIDPSAGASFASGFFSRFAHGVHDAGRTQNYTVGFTILDDHDEAVGVLEKLVHERWADGVILLNPTDDETLLDLLAEEDFPHVLVGKSESHEPLSVDNDNVRVAYDATRHLLAAGRDPILLLSGPSRQTFARARTKGFRAALQDAGLGPDRGLFLATGGSGRDAYEGVAELLSGDAAFRSVLALGDVLAIGAMRALREHGLRIPHDVAVMGMNNDELTEYADPPLSSVELNAYRLGLEAGDLLLARVDGTTPADPRRIVPHELVVRESSR